MRHATFISLSFAALGVAACGDGGHGGHGANSPVAEDGREITVTAEGLSFTPEEIEASVNEDLVVVLTSGDGQHDFTIDHFGAHVVVGPGDTARGGFRPTEPGRYEFYCSVPGHRDGGMEGVLVVE